MDGAPSTAVELLSQQIDELTHVICSENVVTADLGIDFSELQERVNSSIFLQGASPVRPTSESPRLTNQGRL